MLFLPVCERVATSLVDTPIVNISRPAEIAVCVFLAQEVSGRETRFRGAPSTDSFTL
jgi:hypothetical protein